MRNFRGEATYVTRHTRDDGLNWKRQDARPIRPVTYAEISSGTTEVGRTEATTRPIRQREPAKAPLLATALLRAPVLGNAEVTSRGAELLRCAAEVLTSMSMRAPRIHHVIFKL